MTDNPPMDHQMFAICAKMYKYFSQTPPTQSSRTGRAFIQSFGRVLLDTSIEINIKKYFRINPLSGVIFTNIL